MADWVVSQTNQEFLLYFSRALGVSTITAQILVNRGIREPAQARSFLGPTADDLHEPFLLSHMDRAVDRIRTAVQAGERIAVYGDYDVDGLTATAVMVETLRALDAEPLWYVPDRIREGYGLRKTGIEKLARKGVDLIITVDCGTTAVDEARMIQELGIDLIITDHHVPSDPLPSALALINPRRDGSYPNGNLAGVGVAWKLATALLGDERAESMIDLAALGTVSDVVPLVGEHRFIVRRGLERIEAGLRPGLRALRRAARTEKRTVGSSELAFILGPRLNAAGRLGDPLPVVDLLTTGSDEQADVLASFLDRNNQLRQKIEQGVLGDAQAQADRQSGDGPVVLSQKGWHLGVVGIVAAKLCERLGRPVFLLSEDGDIARGSGRAGEGIHLVKLLDHCEDVLTAYGGHAQAAGVTLRTDKIDAFRDRLQSAYAAAVVTGPQKEVVRLEAALEFRDIHMGLLRELAALEPFGCGNAEPIFGARQVDVLSRNVVGKNHLRVRLRQGKTVLEGIAFSKADLWQWLREGDRIDIAFTPMEDTWNGRRTVKLRLEDIRETV